MNFTKCGFGSAQPPMRLVHWACRSAATETARALSLPKCSDRDVHPNPERSRRVVIEDDSSRVASAPLSHRCGSYTEPAEVQPPGRFAISMKTESDHWACRSEVGFAMKPQCYCKKKSLTICEAFLSWRSGRDSNSRPRAWQARILTNWTTGPFCLIFCFLSASFSCILTITKHRENYRTFLKNLYDLFVKRRAKVRIGLIQASPFEWKTYFIF